MNYEHEQNIIAEQDEGRRVGTAVFSEEAVLGRVVLSVSLDPTEYLIPPTCESCGKVYKNLRGYSKLSLTGGGLDLELAEPREGFGKCEVIHLPSEELKECGVDPEKLDPLFPFLNPEVFALVFNHENPSVTYRRMSRFLTKRFIHNFVGKEGCKQYVTQGPPTITSFLTPLFARMHGEGFSFRDIAKAIPYTGTESKGLFSTISRASSKEDTVDQSRLPINPKRSILKWSGIQLSPQSRVVSELEIKAGLR